MINTRDYIIDEAYKLFLTRSYEAVSINDISKSISLTKGALYHHFKNKEDLFKAVIDKYLLINQFSSDINLEMSLREYIDNSMKFASQILLNIFGEKPEFIPINYMELFLNAFRHYPGFADNESNMISTEIKAIKQVLEFAVKSGEIRKDIDTSIMALNFFSIHIGIAATILQNGTPSSSIDTLKSQMDEFYKLLKI